MLAKTMHFSSYSGGHIRSMRGFAVEVYICIYILYIYIYIL
jgi:hypothetical protein